MPSVFAAVFTPLVPLAPTESPGIINRMRQPTILNSLAAAESLIIIKNTAKTRHTVIGGYTATIARNIITLFTHDRPCLFHDRLRIPNKTG